MDQILPKIITTHIWFNSDQNHQTYQKNLKYHVITVSSTHPGDWVYLIDFDPCSTDKDLYLGHAFVLQCWVLEDDRFDNTPWGRTLYAECRSLVNDRVYLLDPAALVDAFAAFLLGYPINP